MGAAAKGVIDTTLLDEHGVKTFPVDHHAVRPTISDDPEVILVAQDFGPLPDPIIVEVTEARFGAQKQNIGAS